MKLQTLSWTEETLRLLDQTRLPIETTYLDITDEKQMWDSIRRLAVRGAPALGVAAAFGVYLGIRAHRGAELLPFFARINEVADYLATSRPTAINLFWALDRIRRAAREAGRDSANLNPRDAIEFIKQRILSECLGMIDEDNRVCRAIGERGLVLLSSIKSKPIQILTHCNAGGLATVQYGTALAPIYLGAGKGIEFHVWADETRPLLQGSRITAYELQANNIPVTLICDSMAASVMRQGGVDAVIVGADRIAANGDVANKIGTLGVAILAKHFGIPFYVAAPISTLDLRTSTGNQIPIEERNPDEISHGFGRQTAPDNVDVFNPAFDVTPSELVTAIITEKGAVTAPYEIGLRNIAAQTTQPNQIES